MTRPVALPISTSTFKVRECGIDGVIVAHDGALKGLAGEFVECQGGLCAVLRERRVDFRHGNVDAEPVDGRDVEQLLRRAAGAGIDERADIGVAGGDHAIEWRAGPFQTTAVVRGGGRWPIMELTVELVDAAWLTKVSVSCLVTAFWVKSFW